MRRRKSPLKDLYDLAALLPWWASLGLAFASWIFLSTYAGREIVPDPSAPLAAAPQALWRGLAQVGQFILPLVLFAGMAANLHKRYRAGGLLDHLGAGGESDSLAGIGWKDFELLVGELFRRRGYAVVETPAGADGGVDLVARRHGGKVLVQCKHWRSRDVGVAVVRELYGVVTAQKASGGAVATGGRFTAEAVKFARQVNIELIDGAMLRAEARGGLGDGWSEPGVEALPDMPGCPVCQSEMVRRIARRGAQAGKQFWGCTRYPACKGTRALG
jgi:restriction system protein